MQQPHYQQDPYQQVGSPQYNQQVGSPQQYHNQHQPSKNKAS